MRQFCFNSFFFNMCNCDELAVFNLDVGGVDVVCERCGDVVC